MQTIHLPCALHVQDFCSRKASSAAAAGSTEESETWTFMGVLFEEDARRQLLAKLGFSEAMLPQAASATAAAGEHCSVSELWSRAGGGENNATCSVFDITTGCALPPPNMW